MAWQRARRRDAGLRPAARFGLILEAIPEDHLEDLVAVSGGIVLRADFVLTGVDLRLRGLLHGVVQEHVQGRIKADLLKIVNEQRGSSISQYFQIQSMEIDTQNLRSTVTGKLNTVVGQKVVSSDIRTFQFTWEYSGLSLKLIGFGMVQPEKKKGGLS